MTCFICTTGTSVSANAGIDLKRFKDIPLDEWDKNEHEIKPAKKKMLRSFEEIDIFKEYDDTSAEIKSLVKMGVTRNDIVVLLCSDTVEGKLCADVVKNVLENQAGCEVRMEKIQGLQAKDGNLFRDQGIKNLLDLLTGYLDRHYDVVLNPTGGYKSIVPYMALVGMLYDKPVKYIHEDSEEVLTLSNIPLTWDESLLFPVEHKFRKIEREGLIRKDEWLSGIDHNDRRYDSLIEDKDDCITLSSVGYLFYRKFRADYPEDLLRDNTPPKNKALKLGSIAHHGKGNLQVLANKLVRSPFVVCIPNSCKNISHARKSVIALTPVEAAKHVHREISSLCVVTDVNSDAGYSFLIETTARNYKENEAIAELLNKKYFP